MEVLVLSARLVLAAVFVVAGIAKLADLPGSRQAMQAFGVSARTVGPAAVALPLAELTVGVLLLPTATAWWAALAALGLLLLFLVGIGYQLIRGHAPDCHCFGQLHSAPAGRSTLIRNGLLALLAAFIVGAGRAEPGPSTTAWLGALTAGEAAMLAFMMITSVVVAGLGWAVLHLLAQQGRLLLRLEDLEAGQQPKHAPLSSAGHQPQQGLPIGTEAPLFVLPGLHGETLTLDALRAPGKPVLLLFADPRCGPCNALLPDVGRWQREHAETLTVAVVSRGAAEANRSKATEHGVGTVLLQQGREVADAYQAHATPTAVLVRPDGTIGSVAIAGPQAIRALVATTVAGGSQARPVVPMAPVRRNGSVPSTAAHARPSRVGTPAPEVALPDLQGRTVRLQDFRGKTTLVLFWNPACGYCRRMLEDVKAWEANRPEGAPELLVISTGSVETNREMDLRSPVLLDEGFATGRAFGASGTPSAVLVDAAGIVASEMAVGAPAVLALAGAAPQSAE